MGDERAAATLAAEHVIRAGTDFLVGIDAYGEDPSAETRRKPALQTRRGKRIVRER